MPATAVGRYASKIIKAGALLSDTKTLLAFWDRSRSVAENLDRVRRENLFGKASRSRIEDILAIFKQRYLADPEILAALVTLAQAPMPATGFDRILYYLSIQNDTLLHDVVTELVLPMYQRGQSEISVADLTRWVQQQVLAGYTERAWSTTTILRVAQESLATLRDFGVLQGIKQKRITPPYLPVEAFCFLALLRYRELQSGERLLRDPVWQLFFLPDLAVERSFIEAHQEKLLEFYAAGRVVRIEFPTLSLEEYARALTQRTY